MIMFLLSECVGFLSFMLVLLVFLHMKQDHLSGHSSSESGMIILEGETGVSSTNEENNFEANKKTDEMTGYFVLWYIKLILFHSILCLCWLGRPVPSLLLTGRALAY